MKLSDLIGQGIPLCAQARRYYLRIHRDGSYAACAVTTGLLVLRPELLKVESRQRSKALIKACKQEFPALWQGSVQSPTRRLVQECPVAICAQLNDYDGWTREQIAEWLRSWRL